MDLSKYTIGFAITGSFCTFSKIIPELEKLVKTGANVIPIMSEISISTDTRFGKAEDFIWQIKEITGHNIISTIKEAEPIGPKNLLDALVIAPCTGNTISKIANSITDTCVTMAAKANLRNENPLIIAISTNDGLGACAKSWGTLINAKNIYFVPFGQDDPEKKPTSLVADMTLVLPTIEAALDKRQIQPVVIER